MKVRINQTFGNCMTEETNYFTLVIYDMVNYILSHSGINEAKWQT